jgi:hypothetical protein
MSLLKMQYEILNRIAKSSCYERRKRAEKREKELRGNLSRLIDDVRNNPKFLEDAEEKLYDFSGDSGYNELVFVKNLRDTYVLTKNGVKKVLELRLEGEPKKLTIKTINSRKLVSDHTDPFLFDQVCDNVQNIIDKYEMKDIDVEKYLIKI